MPNLQTPAVRDWFDQIRLCDGLTEWPPPIRPVEERDRHPVLLAELGQALDRAARGTPERLAEMLGNPADRGELRIVLAQLGAARLLRILHWLFEQDVREAHLVLPRFLAGDDADGCALRAALSALTRRITLQRVFSPDRIAALEAACSDAHKEAA